MAGILVYLPGYDGDSRQELVTRGLDLLLEPSIDAIFTPTRSGPDGGHGRLVTFYPGEAPREVDLQSQQWIEAPPDGELQKGRYWLGYVKQARPKPGELQRANLFDGEPVVLHDGDQWVIPIADFLPKRLTLDPNTGDDTETVASEHREFVAWSNAIFDLFMSKHFHTLVEAEKIVHIPRGITYAGLALSKNYRMNKVAVDLLELVDGFEAFQIARVACGLSTLERVLAQKKRMEESLYQSAGAN